MEAYTINNNMETTKKIKMSKNYRIKRNNVIITIYKGSGNKKTDGKEESIKLLVLPENLKLNEFNDFMHGEHNLRKLVCGSCKFINNGCYCEKGLQKLGILSNHKSTINNSKNVYVNSVLDIPKEYFNNYFCRISSFGEVLKYLTVEEIKYITENTKISVSYSHLNYNLYGDKTRYFMQSVENIEDAIHNYHIGLSSFLVIDKDNLSSCKDVFRRENIKAVNCPASKEQGYKNTCNKCGLCQNYKGKNKVVYIVKH